MTRCVLVCGIGASGTSCVAGALHAMGVPMGHEAHMGQHPAGFGLFEDAEFYGAFQRNNGREIQRLMLRHARAPVWGLKNTLAYKAFDWVPVWAIKQTWDLRIVAVHRAAMASAKGREEGRCPPGVFYSREDAQNWAMQALNEYTAALLDLPFITPVHHVQYEWLVEDAERELAPLARFALADIGLDWDIREVVPLGVNTIRNIT